MKINETLNLKITEHGKDKLKYIFITDTGQIEKQMIGPTPLTLNKRHDVMKYITAKNGLDDYKDSIRNDKIENILIPNLRAEYEHLLREKEEQIKNDEQIKKQSIQVQLQNGKQFYEKMDNNLLFYIKELCDWLSAGETKNIIYAFLAYFSQVCFKSGINVIPVGDASSGKNHIEEVSLSFIPEDHIIMEKGISAAAIFRRAEQDPYFYDGKIVRYGDMGGNKDVEFMEDSINLMKELESESYLNKPLNVNSEGAGWTVKDLELHGTPSITYTTVPGEMIDPQILSRGITITPRVDNQQEFFAMQRVLGFNGVSKDYVDENILPNVEKVKQTILYIMSLFGDENIVFLNPYAKSLELLLQDSAFYKRDYNKYLVLISAIAALDNDRIIEYNNKKYIPIIAEDIMLLESIIDDYIEIVQANLRKGSMIVLNELRELHDNFEREYVFDEDSFMITKEEFRSLTDLNYSKQSISSYFTELVEIGYLEVTDVKKGTKNNYSLTDKGRKCAGVNNIISEPYWDETELPAELICLCKDKDIVSNYNLYDDNYIYFKKPKWLGEGE